VSVLTFQEAKIADAIKVAYLGSNGEQKHGELHGSWVVSDVSSKSEYENAAPLTDIMMMPILDSRAGTLL
jgi:hypothetical protein